MNNKIISFFTLIKTLGKNYQKSSIPLVCPSLCIWLSIVSKYFRKFIFRQHAITSHDTTSVLMTQYIDLISQLFNFRHLMKKMIFIHINTRYILIDILPLVIKSKSICVLLKLLYCIFSSICFIAKQIIVSVKSC